MTRIVILLFVTMFLVSCATVHTDITGPDGSTCSANGSSLFMDVSKVKMKGCGAAMSADGAGVDSATLAAIMKAMVEGALAVPVK